jgi:hypothetical protein
VFCVARAVGTTTYIYDGATWLGPYLGPNQSTTNTSELSPINCASDAFCVMNDDVVGAVVVGRAG